MRDHHNKLAFVLVLSAHVAALYLVERSLRMQHKVREGAEPPPLLVSFLELTPPPAHAGGPSAQSPRRERAPVAPPQPTAAVPAPDSTAITDWHAQAEAAARHIAAGAGRPSHPFGHEFGPAAGRPEPGVFGPRNEHPTGTVEQFEEVERHWVTANCFFDIDRHPEHPLIAGPRVMTPTCKPPAGGGADMFRKLSPGYLTAPPATAKPH
jgi:hypothetical protein